VQRVLADARIELDDEADIVVGRGLAVVEALAEGRPAYVYGDDGGDGWVTPERYERLEADGFSGRVEPTATTFERLRGELEDYDPALGPAGRELAQAHDARAHAHQLVSTFDELKPRRDPVDAPLRELARLVRVESATARRAAATAERLGAAQARTRELEQAFAMAEARKAELESRVAELEQALGEAEARAGQSEVQRGRGVRSLLGREGKVPSSEG
jgi:chromosome segregation ATPase